jgi:hypothetical protein
MPPEQIEYSPQLALHKDSFFQSCVPRIGLKATRLIDQRADCETCNGASHRQHERRFPSEGECIDRSGWGFRQIAGGVSSGSTPQRLASLHLPPGATSTAPTSLPPFIAGVLVQGDKSASVCTLSICWRRFVSHPRARRDDTAGVLEERSGEYVFTQDYLFTSPSTAAAVVLGRTANGWVEWKDKNGATLSDIHRDTNGADDEVTG